MGIGIRTVSAALLLALSVPATAQEPRLTEVLARAGAYVIDFQRQLSGTVSEERYLQDVIMSPSSRFSMRGPIHRELKSDLLLVRPAGADRWIQFRDVFEVDGKAVTITQGQRRSAYQRVYQP